MFKKLTEFSIKYRVPVVVFFLLCGVFFASKIRLLEIDTAIKSQLPNTMPFKNTFG